MVNGHCRLWFGGKILDDSVVVRNFFRSRFSIDDAVVELLLSVALERGGDFAELYFEHRRSGGIIYEDSSVKSTHSALSQGVGIRVVSGDSIGYAYTECEKRL